MSKKEKQKIVQISVEENNKSGKNQENQDIANIRAEINSETFKMKKDKNLNLNILVKIGIKNNKNKNQFHKVNQNNKILKIVRYKCSRYKYKGYSD